MEEYIKKSEIIKKLEKDIDSLRGYSEEGFPISFGMRLGLDGFKHYVENLNNSTSNTNYDHIKSMSVEEMAEILMQAKLDGYGSMTLGGTEHWKQWLLQEVSEDEC